MAKAKKTMRVLLYINLIAIVVIAGALARMYEGTPLPWTIGSVEVTAPHSDVSEAPLPSMGTPVPGAATPEPNPMRQADEIALPAKPAGTEKLRILTEGAYPPFNGRDAQGKLVGYDIDMMREICDRLNRECSFDTRSWKGLLPALKRGEAEVVIASMLVPADKAKAGDVVYSSPYYKTPGHFAARRDGRIGGTALADQKVAVQKGSTHEAFLKARFPRTELLAVATLEEAEAALIDRRTDLLFGDRNALLNWMKHGGGDGCCVMVGGDYDDTTYFAHGAGIALRSNDDALRDGINKAIADMRVDGTEARIARPYFGQSIQ